MRSAGLHGIYRRRGRHARPAPAVHDDLVRRRFVADALDRLWLTDITEHPTREGKVYCAAVLDVYSRRIVGWSIADHLRTELVVDALEMARWRRQPTRGETVVHSDRGSQLGTARIGLAEGIVTTKTLRRRLFALAGRLTRSARQYLPARWPWAVNFTAALARLRAIPLPT